MMEVDVGIPRGPVKFMSPEWRALFKHAVAEAERLGLQITLNAGPGWTGSGGPWVKPEQSMQHLVASAVEVAGPKHFDEVLPRPQRRPAFFGDGQLPPELEKAKNEFYRDEVVLAFPTPAGNERISDIDEKALYVRAPYSSQPGVKARLPSAASYPALPADAVVAADRVVDLTAKLDADGRLAWDVPAGKWTDHALWPHEQRAPAPGQRRCPAWGWNATSSTRRRWTRISRRSSARCCARLGRRKNAAGAGWTMLHIDSWEMGAQNWTAAFREEFRRRRGYDPLRYLPAITGRVVDSHGGVGALPVGFAADGPGVGHREPCGASQGAGTPAWVRPVHRALRHDAVRGHERRRGGGCADVRVLALRVRYDLQCHRGGVHRPHLRAADRGGGVVHLRRHRAVAGVSGGDEGAGRLGVQRGRESHRRPPLAASAVAGPPARA